MVKITDFGLMETEKDLLKLTDKDTLIILSPEGKILMNSACLNLIKNIKADIELMPINDMDALIFRCGVIRGRNEKLQISPECKEAKRLTECLEKCWPESISKTVKRTRQSKADKNPTTEKKTPIKNKTSNNQPSKVFMNEPETKSVLKSPKEDKPAVKKKAPVSTPKDDSSATQTEFGKFLASLKTKTFDPSNYEKDIRAAALASIKEKRKIGECIFEKIKDADTCKTILSLLASNISEFNKIMDLEIKKGEQ